MRNPNRVYIGKSNVYLTSRGEAVLYSIMATVAAAAFLLVLGLVNVNLLTPQECRDGLLSIKDTAACSVYLNAQ